jgi:uncharacterized protein (DUF433 family)
MNRITLIPDLCNGKPTIRGMRITVRSIVEYIAAGETVENILEAYPFLEREDIFAALEYAAQAVDVGFSSYPLAKAA